MSRPYLRDDEKEIEKNINDWVDAPDLSLLLDRLSVARLTVMDQSNLQRGSHERMAKMKAEIENLTEQLNRAKSYIAGKLWVATALENKDEIERCHIALGDRIGDA